MHIVPAPAICEALAGLDNVTWNISVHFPSVGDVANFAVVMLRCSSSMFTQVLCGMMIVLPIISAGPSDSLHPDAFAKATELKTALAAGQPPPFDAHEWARKDANEVLQKDGSEVLKAYLDKAVPLPIAGLYVFDEFWQQVRPAHRRGGLENCLKVGRGSCLVCQHACVLKRCQWD